MTSQNSTAYAQVSLKHPDVRHPLWPPLLYGDPGADGGCPVEVAYHLDRVPADVFDTPGTGVRHWQPLLPPLAAEADLGAGDTPLLHTPSLAAYAGHPDGVYVKDESQNPTWSHKDRLNTVAVSTALQVGAPGVVVASSGNHGASAAAHAARAGLRCVVLASTGIPATMWSLLTAYDAIVLPTPRDERWPRLRWLVERFGLHPVSNLTANHTGHPFGPEGYKPIAYELFLQLGRRVPAAVFVPTGYAELLFGVWKGFEELRRLGLAGTVPRMLACQPGSRAPLVAAWRARAETAEVAAAPTTAFSIGTTVAGYRGIVALRESAGEPVPVGDDDMAAAQRAMARAGLWQELSGAAGVAGLRTYLERGGTLDGPVVCIATSSGFKNYGVGAQAAAADPIDRPGIESLLRQRGLVPV